mmetsp:Transcript_46350/g.91893  ORF Transcript_46350/g.91893 Transcript_46350/m.91893 type:complete len:264 (-) Transcript_46350:290-1081(-)
MPVATNDEEDGLLQDMRFDAHLDGFFTGNSNSMVDLSPPPASVGRAVEAEPKSAQTFDGGSGLGGVASTIGAAAVAAAVAGSKVSVTQSLVAGALESATAAAVPTSMQPVKERAGRLLSNAQPWRDFFIPLSVPSSSHACSRLMANIYHFQTNYAILFVVGLVSAIVLEPSALVSVVVTVVAWMFFLKKNDDPEWSPVVGGVALGPVQRWLLMSAITAIFILFMAGGTVFNAAIFYLLCAIAHGVLHDPAAKGMVAGSPSVPL